MINELRNRIKNMYYHEKYILDIVSNYFGDQIIIYIQDNDLTCWKMIFEACYKSDYRSDANWRGDYQTTDLQCGPTYYGQDISINSYDSDPQFVQCDMDFGSIFMTVVCKNVVIEKVFLEDMHFFWEDETITFEKRMEE